MSSTLTAAQRLAQIEHALYALEEEQRLLCNLAPDAEPTHAADLARGEAIEWLTGQNDEAL